MMKIVAGILLIKELKKPYLERTSKIKIKPSHTS